MLHELGLVNFKPFGDRQTVPLAPITLLYGPNSGGKSSIIQALLLLKQSLRPSAVGPAVLVTRGDLVDLGSFRSLVHQHDLRRSLSIELVFDPVARRGRAQPSEGRGLRRLTSLTFRAGTGRSRTRASLTEARYALQGGRETALDVCLLRTAMGEADEGADPVGPRAEPLFQWAGAGDRDSLAQFIARVEEATRQRRARGRSRPAVADAAVPEATDIGAITGWLEGSAAWPEAGLPSVILPRDTLVGGSSAAAVLVTRAQVLRGLARECVDLLSSISYLGPLRSYPARHYVLSEGGASTVGKTGEHTPQVLAQRLETQPGLVDRWLERLEIPYRLRVREYGDEVTGGIVALQFKLAQGRLTVGPSDVGFGIGQLLPILVEGLAASARLICVEQPELHLHPRLQGHLADFLIESAGLAGNGARERSGNQWLIETHSEALIRRLQRRMREGSLGPDAVSVVYVEPGRDGSRVLPLRMDPQGRFVDEWPGGFFEEAYDELFGGVGP